MIDMGIKRKMQEYTRRRIPVTKKNLKWRYTSFFRLGAVMPFLVELIFVVVGLLAPEGDRYSIRLPENLPFLGVLTLFMAIFAVGIRIFGFMRSRSDLEKIERQEKYLDSSFDEAMAGMLMPVWVKGMKVIRNGDWYMLDGGMELVAIHRNYITGVKRIERQTKGELFSGSAVRLIEITLDTAEHTTLTYRVNDKMRPVRCLCEWLGYPCPAVIDNRIR